MSLSGKSAKILYTSLTGTSSTGEAMTLTQSTVTEYAGINNNAKRHWDRDSTGFVLFLNSTAVSSTKYDVNHVLGRFEFNSTGQSTGTYTANIIYRTASYLTGGRGWTVDIDVDMLDTTVMSTSTADVAWRTFGAGLSGATVTIDRLVSSGDTGPVAYDALNLPGDLVLELVTDQRNRLEGYAMVESDSFTGSVDGLVEEAVDFRVDGQLYWSTSS